MSKNSIKAVIKNIGKYYFVYYQIDGEWFQVKDHTGKTAKFFKTESGALRFCTEKYFFDFDKANSAKTLGSIKSKKKALSSRENGKRGGRPKKVSLSN